MTKQQPDIALSLSTTTKTKNSEITSATFDQRFMANLLDLAVQVLIFFLWMMILGIALIPFHDIDIDSILQSGIGLIIFYAVLFAPTFAYNLVFWIIGGQTIGDQVHKTKLVSNKTNQLAHPGLYLVRCLLYLVFGIVFPLLPFYLIIDLIVFMFSPNRRSLTDMLTGLRTINAPAESLEKTKIDGPEPASFGQRLLANLLDGFILNAIGIAAFIVTLLIGLLFVLVGEGKINDIQGVLLLILYIVFAICGVLYYNLFPWIDNGQTLGDKSFGIKIVDNKTNKVAHPGRYTARILILSLVGIIYILAPFYLVIEAIMFFKSPKKRTLTDRITGLKTISVKKS